MQTRFVLMTALLTLCSGCALAPQTVCKHLPPPPVLGPQGASFQDQIASFLSGSLPEPIDYGLTFKPAAAGLKK